MAATNLCCQSTAKVPTADNCAVILVWINIILIGVGEIEIGYDVFIYHTTLATSTMLVLLLLLLLILLWLLVQ
jgi:uncharacterized membrane protein